MILNRDNTTGDRPRNFKCRKGDKESHGEGLAPLGFGCFGTLVGTKNNIEYRNQTWKLNNHTDALIF